MTDKIDFSIPFNNLGQYVPQQLRNPVVNGLLSNLFDRFMTHDESIPLYGYIGRKPSAPDDKTPRVPQANFERDINAIIPVFNFKRGSEIYSFTVEDILNKAKVLGITASPNKWLYTKANNYLPPINIDKFANFFNYFWIAKSVPSAPVMEWNSELLPEYYTIAKPKDSDLDKLNCIAATTEPIIRTGSGFYDQTFLLKFSNANDFTIVAQNSLGAYHTLPSPPKVVSGTLSGNGTLNIPLNATIVSLTGSGGIGAQVYNPGSPASPPQPIYGSAVTYSWAPLSTYTNPAYTLIPLYPQSGNQPPSTPAGLNLTADVFFSTKIEDGSIFDGYYANSVCVWQSVPTLTISGYTAGSPEIPPSYTNIAGPDTTATLNGITVTWPGGVGPVAGTQSTQTLTSGADNQNLTYSIGTGGSLNYSYIVPNNFAPGTGYAYSLSSSPSTTSVSETFTFDVEGPGGTFRLLTFTIQRDPIYDSNGLFVDLESFVANDSFTITTSFISYNYSVAFNGSSGIKGKVKDIKVLMDYQIIDGVQLKEGDRVLVKNNPADENGIYIVSAHNWSRSSDYDGNNIVAGARTWITDGIINKHKLFTSDINKLWTGVIAQSNTNDWQEGNYWVHVDELSRMDLTRADAFQAVRPIIEYNSDLQLNSYSNNGVPSDHGPVSFKQEKTEFNQLPMFDLFRYDGTHSNLVSSIFFYEEDLTADLDLDLQKRIKLDSSGSQDAIFNHGLIDSNGDMLFYKASGQLKSIWHNGYAEPTAVDSSFVGTSKGKVSSLVLTSIAVPRTWTFTATSAGTFSVSRTLTVGSGTETLSSILVVGNDYIDDELQILITAGTEPFAIGESFEFTVSSGPVASPVTFNGAIKGSITDITPSFYSQQQVWTLTALNATTFSISGSKLQSLPTGLDTVTVGTSYINSEISFTINNGTLPFKPNDQFLIRIGNIEMPRYVYRNSNDEIFDLYGGEAADVDHIGAYQVPRTFIHNPYNECRDSILEGTLFSHFRGILQNQFSDTPNDYAFGGAIKNWSEQHTLLASLLMQRDLTPISVIDLAEREYSVGLNTVADIYKQSIIQYIATNGVIDVDGTIKQSVKLEALLSSILEKRSLDNDVRTVIFDTTAGVLGFPATLPQLGIKPLVSPKIGFDNILGYNVLTHHDGHTSVLALDTLDFRRQVLNNNANIQVTRSDGSTTPAIGSFTTTPPSNPYKGELWIIPSGVESYMMAFDVDADTVDAPSNPFIGMTWYARNTATLRIWDGGNWVVENNKMIQWRMINLADTLNQLILLVETKLHNHINPNARKVDFNSLLVDAEFNQQMKRELFTFAANNNLSPLGSDYNPNDAFTWNYSSASLSNFPNLATSTVPARWYNVLKEHQKTFFGIIPTERPNLEPWKLLGFPDLNPWWNSLSSVQQAAFTPYAQPSDLQNFNNAGYVKAAKTDFGATTLNGLQIVDGVNLANGDLVLLQNEVGPENNGIWVVSTGLWTRANIDLTKDTFVQVQSGVINYNTIWALSNDVATVNVDPVLFKQVRYWTDDLWAHVKALYPTLRLSVDTKRDALLPPYLSPTLTQSINALTTVVPSNITNTYQFGEGSPVETVWKTSIEYGYSLARALFRHDPLQFLGFCWGFNWVQVDNILYDGYDINTPGHKRFKLHGDQVRIIDRSSCFKINSASSSEPIDLTITFDAYEVVLGNRYQNFSVRNNLTGLHIGYLREGVAAVDLSYQSLIQLFGVTIEDYGQPFHIGDKFNLTANADGSNLIVTFTSEPNYKFLGFGQIFTNALRSLSIDTNDSFAIEAYRGWDVNMGYRAGGLVATDDLQLRTDSDTLSSSNYSIVFKKNSIAKDLWVHGLRISVSRIGSNIISNDVAIPKTDGSDWVFFIEGYNPRYLNIEYYNVNTAGLFETFNILDQRHTSTVWKTYTENLNVVSTFLPLTITGIQNVINFIVGYSRYLEDQGWRFNLSTENNIDISTGRSRNWQLEVEKYVDACYVGLEIGRGHIVNPFMDQIWVKQDTGLLSNFIETSLFDITGHPGVFDIAGIRMPIKDLMVTRGNEQSQFGANTPMYSAHAQIDNYEHLFIFNNYINESSKSDLLYNPFSGARVITYKFNGRKQGSQTFRPEFGGHYLLGGKGESQVRQNLQASTDNVANFYDANKVFENDLTSRHALALLGFNSKDYFIDLDITNKSQFNFWRGLIQSKGTNMSVDAYLNNNRFEDAKIDEYWAYKVAEYGDARQKSFPELKLLVDDTIQQFTQFQFDATEENGKLDDYTQISRLDESRWFTLEDLNQDTFFKAESVGTYSRQNFTQAEVDKVPFIINLPFVADKLVITGTANVSKINATTLLVNSISTSSTLLVVGYGAATPRYNPVKLFNYVDNELVEEIPLWHPAVGQHTPTAMESINIISTQNPAKYNYSTQVVNNNSYDPLRPWGNNEIGRVWFDTRNLVYIPYYDETIFSDRATRLSRWGALADFASIDVYEWIKSSVPPSEYNALALKEAGDGDLNPETKAAGEVALKETYVRNRRWFLRPVAWSYSSIPTSNTFDWQGSPPFSASYNAKLYFESNGRVSLDVGSFESFDIKAGMHIGTWDPSSGNSKPTSEYVINNVFSKIIIDTTHEFVPIQLAQDPEYPASIVNLSFDTFTKAIGSLSFTAEPLLVVSTTIDDNGTPITTDDYIVQLTVTDSSGISETVVLNHGPATIINSPITSLPIAAIEIVGGSSISVKLEKLGLTLSVVSDIGSTGTYEITAWQKIIIQAFGNNISLRDAASVTPIVPWNSGNYGNPYVVSNDPNDLEYTDNAGLGWRAWSVPTQAELDADGKQPVSSWRPYLGDFAEIQDMSILQVQEAVTYAQAPLTLNDGTIIEKTNSEWTVWNVLKDEVLSYTQTSSVANDVVLTHSTIIDATKTSVYVNGISLLSAAYKIVGQNITVLNVLPGSEIKVIIRKYEPSSEELVFNPEVEDNLSYQQQYKQDYEYVALPVRDSEGTLSSIVYYFWVKNKSTSAKNKKLSIQAITNELANGPANYLTFQHLIGDGTSNNIFRYDAISISGLSYIVGKENTFKLRFTRNFTLRDDPENLELKDTHTEWALMRPNQKIKIPEPLWNKMVDSACGVDFAGNTIPELRRVLYDERNGTSIRYGFGPGQALAPKDLLISSISYTIVNTKLINKSVPKSPDGTYPVDFIDFLDFDQSDSWFATPESTRQILTDIWTKAKVTQINEIFFAALNDILSNNYEVSDIFKTSRLSAYSIKVVDTTPAKQVYE